MRAVEPCQAGHLTVAGYRIGYEIFGDPAEPAVLLLPTWQIVHSRHWKFQVPFLARFRRVVTFDMPGNGAGERTTDPAAYALDRVVDYAVGLLDYLGIERADIAGLSMGGSFALWLAARYPERVRRAVVFSCSLPEGGYQVGPAFWERHDTYEDSQKYNAHYWREHYDDWLDVFFHRFLHEPHSTKQIDDAIGWGRETTPEMLIAAKGDDLLPAMPLEEALERVRCPVLIIQGGDDRVLASDTAGRLVGARPDFQLAIFEGSGHAIPLREPVRANLLMREFLTDPTLG